MSALDKCARCDGTGMMQADAFWNRTCKHCFGSGLAHPLMDKGAPHAIDHDAYASGVVTHLATGPMAELEQGDPFWKNLGGDEADPWGDGGEIFRQRSQAVSLGIGLNIYENMIGGEA